MRNISSHTGRDFFAFIWRCFTRPILEDLRRAEDRVLIISGIIAGNLYVV